MKETSGREFSKNDPFAGKRFDFFKDVVAAEFFHNTSPDTAFDNFMKKTGATKHYFSEDDRYEWTGNNFVVERISDVEEGMETRFALNNKGNKLISCAGIEIGMTADEAARIYEATLRKCYASSDKKQTFTKRTYEGGHVYYFVYKTGDMNKDGSTLEDCVTMNVTNNIITSFYYCQTYSYEVDVD